MSTPTFDSATIEMLRQIHDENLSPIASDQTIDPIPIPNPIPGLDTPRFSFDPIHQDINNIVQIVDSEYLNTIVTEIINADSQKPQTYRPYSDWHDEEDEDLRNTIDPRLLDRPPSQTRDRDHHYYEIIHRIHGGFHYVMPHRSALQPVPENDRTLYRTMQTLNSQANIPIRYRMNQGLPNGGIQDFDENDENIPPQLR